jgi:NAD(P)-dependent dehydrogenase (short-subunit alcohol dehydrogenase family)
LNAALIDPLGPLGSLNGQAIMEAINVNLASSLLLINSFLRWSPTSSKIFVIGTGAVNQVIQGWDIYSISKGGLRNACDFVNLQNPGKALWIDPGAIDTNMQAALRDSNWAISGVKFDSAEDVAKTVLTQILT